MDTIKLNREWSLGEQFASGGFGQIHSGRSDAGDDVVIKLIPKMPGGDRELWFADLAGAENVLPILDSGEWKDSWVLVMPRADKSLRDHLDSRAAAFPVDEAVEILRDIVDALASLEGEVVHRDLKPENILLFEGRWCLADFGIARYAEATTATETWKEAKTWAYAAPEQWRGERATAATDIYATGVVAYELLVGAPPFRGPEEHNFREQHLHEDPPAIPGSLAPLASLVSECLFKAPGARPAAQNVQARLQTLGSPASAAGQRLQEADHQASLRRSGEEARASEARSAAEERDALAQTADKSLSRILEALRDRIQSMSLQSAMTGSSPTSWRIKLLEAEIGVGGLNRAQPSSLDSPGFPAPFDVVSYSSIYVQIPADQWGYEGRSHALWYCDAQEDGLFRWYETAFMFGVFFGRTGKKNPFALDPESEVGRALAPINGTQFQAAWPFTPIDQGQEEEFFERWIGWFADAAEGKLRRPSTMPEKDPSGSWRSGPRG